MNSAPVQIPTADLDDPLYYLRNFRVVLDWVGERYGDLLDDAEHRFLERFPRLPEASQALFARMVMRKGEHFRATRLDYPEVGDAREAAGPLIEQRWLEDDPPLDLATLFRLYTKRELGKALGGHLEAAGLSSGTAKSAWQAALAPLFPHALTPAEWQLRGDTVYRLTVMPLCDRLRLMFFGNLRQDWSEFVLAELGTFQYEPVALDPASRPFHSRNQVDAWLHLHACRQALEEGEPLAAVEAALPARPVDSNWLAERRDRLVFRLAREWERAGELERARLLYQDCAHAGARGRLLRVMELQADYQAALDLARRAQAEPESEAERQQLTRLLPRLHRKLGLAPPKVSPPVKVERLELELAFVPPVERAAAEVLHDDDAPVYYVENWLLGGLFGLLCWDAVFAPLPGAFFHPFQSGPADLFRPDFHERRRVLFESCLGRLRDGSHARVILENFHARWGRSSPFVHWGVLHEELIRQALACIPAGHLELCFRRMLVDLKANRAGLPDLIQLWPAERRYRMVEVKGPGDRLQDNQRRWLDFFTDHDMPVAVCHVQWREEA